MLKVLALRPGHEEAQVELRKSISRQAQAEQAAKLGDKTNIKPPHPNAKAEGSIPQMRKFFDAGNFEEVISLRSNSESRLSGDDTLLVRSSHVALADRAAMQGNRLLELDHLQAAVSLLSLTDDPAAHRITALKIDLSEHWYREGSGMIQMDLGRAISALEKSVGYNPNNTGAKLKLKQARTLQRNLDEIKGG